MSTVVMAFTMVRAAAAQEGEILKLLEQGETEAAESLLVTALEQKPESPRLLALLGTARYLDRRYLAAEDPLRRAVELGQRDLSTQYYLTSTLWENGRMEEAEETCLSALESHGSQLPLVHLLGSLYLWQGRYEEARDWLEKATELSPRSVDLWLDLAGALDGAGQVDEAVAAYRRAVDLAPEHYQARYGLARTLEQTGESAAAQRELAVYRRLLDEDQQRTRQEGLERSQIDLGYDYLRQGKTEAAVAHLEGLAMTADRQVALARAYRQAGDAAAAIAALETAVALSPQRQDLRALLAAARVDEERQP